MSLPSIEALTTGYFFSACTAALAKKDMKPSLTPCSFSKRSWYFLRNSITGAMFTSLKVVRMPTSTPSTGAGSSSTTLSVSMSIRFSSRFTASPCFLCQASNVASDTDSESCGTLTSTSIRSPLAPGALHRQHEIVRDFGERGLDQLLLLLDVERQVAYRRRSRRFAHRIPQHLVRAHVAQDVVLVAMPGTLIAGLLLAPDHLGRLRVEVDLRLELVVRERVPLRDAHDRRVLDALLLARGHQVEEHLAAAQD